MCYLATLLLLAAASPTDVTVTTLDSGSLVGQLESWSDGQIVLATPEGPQQVSERDVLFLRWPREGPSGLDPIVKLADGSVLPISGYRTAGARAAVAFDRPSALGDPTASLPVRQVAAVRLQLLEAELVQQWNEILDLGAPADLLVLLRRGGLSLDYIEGVLGDVSATDVEFTVDGRTAQVDRTKVAGIVYYRSVRSAEASPRCVLEGGDALRINASDVRLDDGALHITTTAGIQLQWPTDDFSLADFSAGKLVFVSDLEPTSQRWTPLVSLPTAASVASGYGRPRFDGSAFGGPLTLRWPADGTAAAGREQSFAKGVALRSRTELEYRLPRGYRRLLAVAGIEPKTAASGRVQLTIRGDGQTLLDAAVDGGGSPLAIDLDVEGVRRLAIIVDYGENLDTGDWLNLCNARIVK